MKAKIRAAGRISQKFLERAGQYWAKISRQQPFPSNVILTAPHGSHRIPLSIFPKLSPAYQMSPRLLLNFSDYGTAHLLEGVPERQCAVAKYGRLVGDCNRRRDAADLIRFRDFGENPIFSPKFENRLTTSWFHSFWKNKILKLSYDPFYEEVFGKIEQMVKNPENYGKPLVLVDLHDTGNLILGQTRKSDFERQGLFRMPKLIVSNAPDEEISPDVRGTAPEYLIDFFQKTLGQKCGFAPAEVRTNHLFIGQHLIRFFGNPSQNPRLAKILGGRILYTFHLEFDRALYLNESTQKIIRPKMAKIRTALHETLREMNEVLICPTE